MVSRFLGYWSKKQVCYIIYIMLNRILMDASRCPESKAALDSIPSTVCVCPLQSSYYARVGSYDLLTPVCIQNLSLIHGVRL